VSAARKRSTMKETALARRLAVLAGAAALVSCSAGQSAKRPPPEEGATQRLELARRRAAANPQDAAAQIEEGWLDYLVTSDPEAARKKFDEALAMKPLAPAEERALALLGEAEIDEDRLQFGEAGRAYFEALQSAPQSPLAELAADRLLEAEGDSRAIDDQILAAARSLGAGTQARAAQLIRQAAAHVAGSRALESPGSPAAESEAWAAAGAVQRWRVAGPFAAERLLDLERPTALDTPALTRAPQSGPAGSTAERSLEFPDGDVGLDLEPGEGDLFYAASTLEVARGGDYLLLAEGAGALEARLDGSAAISRSPWPREEPRAQMQPVHLAAGSHALLVRWSRAEGAHFRISLARADGEPTDIVSRAPAQLEGQRLASRCALGTACTPAAAFADTGGLRGEAERRLARDPADPLAAFLLVRATLKEDRDAARGSIDRLIAATNGGAPALLLRVVQVLSDGDVPERIGRAHALADLTSALEKDPRMLRAALTLAAMQRDAERTDEAAAVLARAERSARALAGNGAPLPPRLLLARARLLDAQGNTALARAAADSARSIDGGRCDALGLAQELSRREGSLADQKALTDALVACPEQRGALPQLLRDRGDLAGAEAILEKMAAMRPAQPQRIAQLAELQAARGEVARAIETLRRAVAVSPRASDPWRHIAAWLDLSGDAKGALAAREEALARLPADLQLRRQIALARGTHLMSWSDRDGLELARRAAALPSDADASERPAALRLLDYGGVEFASDGTAVERVHTLVRLLDKTGIARFGEVQIPGDAELLELRTIKPDGRVLEPEAIPEKETHSLPGLEPGDVVEYDYLRSYSPRGPELPGISPGAFFFADEETPMVESTYEVRAPASVPLEVDARNLPPQAIERAPDGSLRFVHTDRDIAPSHPEPNQPSEEEISPWVQVGYGAHPDQVGRSLADWAILRARPTLDTDALAAKAGGATPREKVERIVAAVAQEIPGRINGADFSAPAQHVLALGRGNRLLVIKAALASAGVRAHLALVKPFGALPETPRFPRGDLYSFAVLRVDAQAGLREPIWIDATWRRGPVDQLPPFARGQAALLLPEPGDEPSRPLLARTPGTPNEGDDGRTMTFALKIGPTGETVGQVHDEVAGFEAAALREALEQLDEQSRRQAVEQMLARAIPRAALESLTVAGESAQGGPASLDYTLHADLGRPDGPSLRLPSSLSPANLSRRFAEKSERKKPILLQLFERFCVRAELKLPPGLAARSLPAPIDLQTPFGRYRWSAQQKSGALLISEELSLPPQRISPANYPAFVAFTRAVDQAQGRDLLIEPP